jgi:hypothetical protein
MPLDGSNERKSNTMLNGWKVIERTNNSRMDKYENQFVIVVSNGKRNKYVYLMPKVLAALGNPQKIMFLSRGSNIAMASTDNGNGYKVQTQKGGHFPYVQIIKIIETFSLKAGVYNAHVENDMVVFDSADTPARA